jgi:hypothetical protein
MPLALILSYVMSNAQAWTVRQSNTFDVPEQKESTVQVGFTPITKKFPSTMQVLSWTCNEADTLVRVFRTDTYSTLHMVVNIQGHIELGTHRRECAVRTDHGSHRLIWTISFK